jgi:predicted enzyme related to lactoylglutathione lyase
MWHQLLTRDVPGAKDFYTSLVGWKSQAWPLDPNYTVCHAGDAPAAGIMEFTPDIPAEAPPHWLPYIGTRDVDSVAEAAVRAGGSIIKEPSDLKGAGRYAVLKDPQGAVFAIIDPENARAESKGMMPPLGHFSWHELATSDTEAAFAFYSELFGWDAITRMDMGANLGLYLIFGKDGVQRGGMYLKPAEMPAPPNWLSYAHVPDVDESVAVVEAGGGRIIQPPMEVPGGSRIAILVDPSGATFALNSMPAVSAVKPKAKAPQATPKAAPKAKAKPKTKPPKSKPKTKPKAKPKASPKVKAKAKKKAPPKPKAAVKTKAKSKANAKKKTVKKSSAGKNVKKSARRKK